MAAARLRSPEAHGILQRFNLFARRLLSALGLSRLPRGGDSHCQTDGDDGDGQGGRFWAEQHRPKGEAPFKRAAGGKNFEP